MTQLWANNRARIIVTGKCNINCVYCHNEGQPKNYKFITDDLINRISQLMTLNEKQLDAITFSGGEPLLHNNIYKIIEKLSKHSLKRTLVTNGILLDEKILARIKEAGITKIRLGMDSITKVKSRPTSGKPPNRPIKEVIEMLLQTNTNFELNVVLSKFNSTEIEKIISYCFTNKISAKFFELVEVEEFGDIGKEARLKSKEAIPYSIFRDAALRVVSTMLPCGDMGKANVLFDGIGENFLIRYCHYLCDYGLCYKTGTRIDADGSVYTCMGQRGKLWINNLEPINHSVEMLEKAMKCGCKK